jgi:hypothetical protein
MKTRYLKIDWLIPVLGIAVVAGSLVAATTYLDLERKAQAEESFTATLDRLYEDQQLSTALKTLHDGAVDAGVQRLDLLLCGHILRTDSELASAGARTRTFVEDAFRRIAQVRPKSAHSAAAGSGQECSDDQSAAQRILELALAGNHSTQTK